MRSKLAFVLKTYSGCNSVEHKATVIRWAKRVLSGKEMEWFGFAILKTHDFDLVLQHYKEVG